MKETSLLPRGLYRLARFVDWIYLMLVLGKFQDGMKFEDLAVGMTATGTRIMRAGDSVTFGVITGDLNWLHFDETYAATTIFRRPAAHGVLTGGHPSRVIGTQLPGPGAVLRHLTCEYPLPVRFGALVKTEVKIESLNEEESIVIFSYVCSVQRRAVMKGEAVVFVPRRVPLPVTVEGATAEVLS